MSTTKTFDNADFSTTTCRRTASKKHSRKLSRKERAEIRYLFSRGVSKKNIATEMGRGRSSVSDAIRNCRKQPDNIEKDYEYIGDGLKPSRSPMKRPPTPFEPAPKPKPLVSSLNAADDAEYVDSGSEDDMDSDVPLKTPVQIGAHGGHVQQRAQGTIRPGVSESTKKHWDSLLTKKCNINILPAPPLVDTPIKTQAKMAYTGTSLTSRCVQKKYQNNTVVLDFVKPPGENIVRNQISFRNISTEERYPQNEPEADDIIVLKFLKGLDQDLSCYYPELKDKELGTAAKLFLFAKKEYAEELPQLIKDTLPDIPPAHRYILLKGLKGYKKTHTHGKACHV